MSWAISNVFISLFPNPPVILFPSQLSHHAIEHGNSPMPTTKEHIDKQTNTQITLSYLQQSQNNPQHADWIVTLAFYKALHAVDSYLARKNIHPKGHESIPGKIGRNQSVKKHLSTIYSKYKVLYRASRKARYDAYTYYHKPQDVMKLVNQASHIEKYINSLLKTP